MRLHTHGMLAELESLQQWVGYVKVWDDKRGKYRKQPKNAKTGGNASCDDPNTWTDYHTARAAVFDHEWDGCGFEFAGGYLGIDLDDCIDDAGKLTDTAAEIVKAVDSYTEYSPSRHGLHIICKYTGGEIGQRRDEIGLEIYNHGRYFTVTGEPFGEPRPIAERTAEVDAIRARYFSTPVTSPQPTVTTGDAYKVTCSDKELWQRMFNSKRGDDIRALYDGNTSGYGDDHSRADAALCQHLAYWTNGDAARIDRMFRQSGLIREKWDERRGVESYGQKTIKSVLANYTLRTKTQPNETDDDNTMTDGELGWNDPISDDGDGQQAAVNATPVTSSDRNAALIADRKQTCLFISDREDTAAALESVGQACLVFEDVTDLFEMLKAAKQEDRESHFYLCLYDNDAVGRKHERAVYHEMKQLNVTALNAAPWVYGKEYKAESTPIVHPSDVAHEAFAVGIQNALRRALRPNCTLEYVLRNMSGDIETFKASSTRKTGFSNLDSWLHGLYSGLYVVAALSSLGKTTFVLQMADQLAAAGENVIIYSLEQSTLELVSKSIARLVELRRPQHDVTSLDIRLGKCTNDPVVLAAIREYTQTVGDRISICEGNFNTDVKTIRTQVKNYMEANKVHPVVIVDYLQILTASAKQQKSGSKKDEVDDVVTELKRISRDLDITVIAISSINRANYLLPFSMDSLKESGGIEYTADVVLGMQLACLDEELFDSDKQIKLKRERVKAAKDERPRKIKVVCEKNRYGITDGAAWFDYYPASDLFKAADAPTTDKPLLSGNIISDRKPRKQR